MKMHIQYLLESQVSVFSTYFVFCGKFFYFKLDPCFAIVVVACIFLCFMFEGPTLSQTLCLHLMLYNFYFSSVHV